MDKAKNTQKIKKLVAMAMFTALAYAIHFVHIPVGFLNLDFKDVVTAIAGMYFGPVAGVIIAVAVPLIELFSSSTGVYGLIMNVISSVVFVATSSVIYKFKKSMSGAIIALVSAVFATTAVMMGANLIVTPYYMHVTTEAVVELIPALLLPFNAIKSILNASLTLCLYKPMTAVLKRAGFDRSGSAKSGEATERNRTYSLLVWIIGGAVAVVSLCIIFFVLGGSIAFG